MLFDPNWEAGSKAKSQPWSLEHIIAWLETKPADERYLWGHHNICCSGQYAKAVGVRAFLVPPGPMYEIALGNNWRVNEPSFYTFGAALERARAIAARS